MPLSALRASKPQHLGIAGLGLIVLAVPYLQAGLPVLPVAAILVLSFALGAASPGLALAAVLGLAPLADGIIDFLLSGNPFLHEAIGFSWLEAMAIGAGAGMLVRQLRVPGHRPLILSAGRPFVAVALASLCWSLIKLGLEWDGAFPSLLALCWRGIPVADPAGPEHTLRAGLLFLAAPLWFSLIRRSGHVAVRTELIRGAWMAGGLLSVLYGTWAWMTARERLWPFTASLMEDKNSYASYLVLTFFLSWAVLASSSGRTWKYLAGASLSGAAWMLLLSGSRVAILAVLLSAGVAAALWLRRQQRSRAAMAVLVLLLLAPPAAWLGWRAMPGRAAVTLSQATSPRYLWSYLRDHRFAVWNASLTASLENPLLGLGPGLLYRNLGRYEPPGDPSSWRPGRENAHNYFLQVAAELGLPGLVFFCWMVAAAMRPSWSRLLPDSFPSRLLGLGAAGFLLTCLTGHPLLLSRQVVLFWSFLGLLDGGAPRLGAGPAHGRPGRGRLLRWLLPALLLPVPFLQPRTPGCPGGPGSSTPPIQWDFAAGFYAPESSPAGPWRWSKGNSQLRFCNTTASPLFLDLDLQVASFHEDRQVAISAGGRPLSQMLVPAQEKQLHLEGLLLPPGSTSLIFQTAPEARRVHDILRTGDMRTVALRFMGEPRLSFSSPQHTP
ncbi:MAG: O-antigen ligase family protein [Acidobacteriota bacterium]